MSDPIDNAAERATAAIKALADAGHRKANEHAHALDMLRAQVESLRAINANLRAENDRLEAKASFYTGPVPGADVMEALRTQNRHLRERLAALDVRPVDTEAPREVVRGTFEGWPCMSAGGSVNRVDSGRWAWRGNGFDAHNPWRLCQNGDSAVKELVNESAAIAWVLDGVLP